jgi:AAHS family 4-hydroxybenzoate transporter-like MFS transporter
MNATRVKPVSLGPPVDVGQILDEGNWSRYQKRVVLLTALTIIFDGVDNQLLGLAIPSMMRDWSLPRAIFANVAAVTFAGMMIGAAAGGVIGDRLGRRVALIGSMLTFGALTLTIATVNGIGALGAVRFLVGLGLGGAMPNATALSSEFVPRRYRPFAITLTIVCIPLGGTLAGLFAERALPALGWRGLFMIGGLVPFVVAFLLTALLPESPRYLARHSDRWPSLVRILQRAGHPVAAASTFVDTRERAVARVSIRTLLTPEFRLDTLALWAAYLSCLLAVYLGFTWVPSMLTGAGLPALAAAGLTVFNLGGVVGAIGGSLVITRAGSRGTMLTMTAGAIAGALVMRSMTITSTSQTLPIITMLAITGGLINAVQTTMYALAAHVYPTEVRSTGVGSATAIGRAGAILSTYAGAWALDAGGSPAFFTLVAAAMCVCAASLALIRHHIPAAA